MAAELVGRGIAVIWSTAYLDEAERCDEVLLLNAGRALYAGPPALLTTELAGRSFLVNGLGGARRAVLEQALDHPAVIDGIPILARTAGLIAHLAEEAQTPIGFRLAEAGEEAIEHTAPFAEG